MAATCSPVKAQSESAGAGMVYIGVRFTDMTVYDQSPTDLSTYASLDQLVSSRVAMELESAEIEAQDKLLLLCDDALPADQREEASEEYNALMERDSILKGYDWSAVEWQDASYKKYPVDASTTIATLLDRGVKRLVIAPSQLLTYND